MDGRTHLGFQICSYTSQKIQTDKIKNGKMTVDIMAVRFSVDCVICQQCFWKSDMSLTSLDEQGMF